AGVVGGGDVAVGLDLKEVPGLGLAGGGAAVAVCGVAVVALLAIDGVDLAIAADLGTQAVGAAAVPRRGVAVVADLVDVVDGPVPAELQLADLATAVARRGVAVVALLPGIQEAVAAGGDALAEGVAGRGARRLTLLPGAHHPVAADLA